MGATKIATGHNLDDEVQAIMMNYLEGNTDNLTKLGAKTSSKAKEFTVKIKPLREIPEREIGLYVVAKNWKFILTAVLMHSSHLEVKFQI